MPIPSTPVKSPNLKTGKIKVLIIQQPQGSRAYYSQQPCDARLHVECQVLKLWPGRACCGQLAPEAQRDGRGRFDLVLFASCAQGYAFRPNCFHRVGYM